MILEVPGEDGVHPINKDLLAFQLMSIQTSWDVMGGGGSKQAHHPPLRHDIPSGGGTTPNI